MKTDSERLNELKAIIERRAFEHLTEYQRCDYNLGCQSAYKTLLKDLEKLEEGMKRINKELLEKKIRESDLVNMSIDEILSMVDSCIF